MMTSSIATTSPPLAPRLAQYLAQAPSTTQFGSAVLAERPYQSLSIADAELSFENITQEYIAAYVPTPKSAGEIAAAGVANFLSPAWQQEVSAATERNGGLGDSENGFLAWSSLGFVRLRNPLLTPEQNRKLAEISLALGIEVSKLPARSDQSSVANENIDRWVNDFIAEYEQELAQFLENPSDRIRIKDGRRYYVLELKDTPTGETVPVSYYYKKSGGIGSFLRGAFGDFAKIAAVFDPLSLAVQGIAAVSPKTASVLESATTLSAGLWSELRRVSERLAQSDFSLRDILNVAATEGGRALQFTPGLRYLAPVLNFIAAQTARTLVPEQLKQA